MSGGPYLNEHVEERTKAANIIDRHMMSGAKFICWVKKGLRVVREIVCEKVKCCEVVERR